MQPLSLWRYGSADPGAFSVLRETIDRQREARTAEAAQSASAEPAPETVAETPIPSIDVRSNWQEDSIRTTSSIEETTVIPSEGFDLTQRVEMLKRVLQQEIRRFLKPW
jgi:hypothetical protein